MTHRARTMIGLIMVCSILAVGNLPAQQPASVQTTTVQVTDMHCANCAKKISRKLYAVPGVAQVKTDVGKHIAVVVPDKKRQPNPLALWEAVESAGFEPVLLRGPFGEFDDKEKLQQAVNRTASRR